MKEPCPVRKKGRERGCHCLCTVLLYGVLCCNFLVKSTTSGCALNVLYDWILELEELVDVSFCCEERRRTTVLSVGAVYCRLGLSR